MKKVIFIAASLLAIAACNKPVFNVQNEVGYLNFNLAADDIIVTTKAVVKDLDGYIVHVDNNTYGNKTYDYGTIKDEVLEITPDSYTVYAENKTPEKAHEGNGSLRLASAPQEVTVAAGGTSEVTLHCTAVNAKITVTFDESFKAAFDSWNVTLGYEKDNTRNMTVTNETSAENAVFFYNIYYDSITNESITNLAFALSATTKHGGNAKTKTTTLEKIKAGHHYTVNYSAGTSGYVDITVSADDQLLNGGTSDVTVNPYASEQNS